MIEIDRSLCDVCGACIGVCGSDAISIVLDTLAIDHERCALCLCCIQVCPAGALGERS